MLRNEHTEKICNGEVPSRQAAHVVDLRSDTQTVPTPAMYDAMMRAPVGNDVYGEDPTVNELEARCAELLGKESSVFVPSGTMGNLLAIMVHCERLGCEIMVGDKSHIFNDEQGGSSQFAHAHVQTLKNLPDGTFNIDEMTGKIRDASDYHCTESVLVCLENTHNLCGGKVLPIDFLEKVHAAAKTNGLAVHMDGARLWHSAVALNTSPSNIAKYCDSLNVCFSKGMGCPVGSLIAGTTGFIERCRRSRKALGGGMRQAGLLAGAALYALDHVYPRLNEDHRRAKTLAIGIVEGNHAPLSIDVEGIHTNIVMMMVAEPWSDSRICDRLQKVTDSEREELGESISVLVEPVARQLIRFVTYLGITDDDIHKTIKKCNFVFKEMFA